jgi:hypothetical protein
MHMFKICSKLTAQFFGFAADTLLYQWQYIIALSERSQQVGFFFENKQFFIFPIRVKRILLQPLQKGAVMVLITGKGSGMTWNRIFFCGIMFIIT